jgi:hypothetical protein
MGIVLAAALEADPFIPDAPVQPAAKQDQRDAQGSVAPPPTRQAAPQGTPQRGGDEIVNVSELDELRAELRALKAENNDLKRLVNDLKGGGNAGGANAPGPQGGAGAPGEQPAAVGNAPAKPMAPKAAAALAVKPPRKSYSQIEIGMTRQDVDFFIRTHKNLKLVGVSANSGVSKQSEETVVQSEDNSGSTRVARQGRTDSENLGPGTVNEAQQATAGEHKQRVERRYSRGKSEIITVAQLVNKKVVTGQQRNSLGGSTPVYGNRMVEGGRLRIEMTDDVVTAVDGVQY